MTAQETAETPQQVTAVKRTRSGEELESADEQQQEQRQREKEMVAKQGEEQLTDQGIGMIQGQGVSAAQAGLEGQSTGVDKYYHSSSWSAPSSCASSNNTATAQPQPPQTLLVGIPKPSQPQEIINLESWPQSQSPCPFPPLSNGVVLVPNQTPWATAATTDHHRYNQSSLMVLSRLHQHRRQVQQQQQQQPVQQRLQHLHHRQTVPVDYYQHLVRTMAEKPNNSQQQQSLTTPPHVWDTLREMDHGALFYSPIHDSDWDVLGGHVKPEPDEGSMANHPTYKEYSFAGNGSMIHHPTNPSSTSFIPAHQLFSNTLPETHHGHLAGFNHNTIKPERTNAVGGGYCTVIPHHVSDAGVAGVSPHSLSFASSSHNLAKWLPNSLQDSRLNYGQPAISVAESDYRGLPFTPRTVPGPDYNSSSSFSSCSSDPTTGGIRPYQAHHHRHHHPGGSSTSSFSSSGNPDTLGSSSGTPLFIGEMGASSDLHSSPPSFSSSSSGAHLTSGLSFTSPPAPVLDAGVPNISLPSCRSSPPLVAAGGNDPSHQDPVNSGFLRPPFWKDQSPSMATSTESLGKNSFTASTTPSHLPFGGNLSQGQAGQGVPQLIAPRPRRPLPSKPNPLANRSKSLLTSALNATMKDSRTKKENKRPRPSSSHPSSRSASRSPSPPPLTSPKRITKVTKKKTCATGHKHRPLGPHVPIAPLSQIQNSIHSRAGVIYPTELGQSPATAAQAQAITSPRDAEPDAEADAEADERARKDGFLLWAKNVKGWTYSQIKIEGGFTEAESTLRGRYRMLSKAPEERIRKPQWSDLDVVLLEKGVRSLATNICTSTPFKSLNVGINNENVRPDSKRNNPFSVPRTPAPSLVPTNSKRSAPGLRLAVEATTSTAVIVTRSGQADFSTYPHNVRIPWKQVSEFIYAKGGSYKFGNSTCRKKWDSLVEEHVTHQGKDINHPFFSEEEEGGEEDEGETI